MKRFWTDVTVADRSVRLDGRPVKTPARADLILPSDALAEAIADEWRTAGDRVDPRAMPLTGLANAAIDRPVDAASLAAYGETDLLCYRAEAPPELVARQAALWDPMLDWARARYDVAFVVTAGIGHAAQPPATLARLTAAVDSLGTFERTALSPLVTISGSLITALMVRNATVTPDAAFEACHLDELWQASKWGEDSLATQARETRRRDFLNAARFLRLL